MRYDALHTFPDLVSPLSFLLGLVSEAEGREKTILWSLCSC
jgi:hypothetical protein